MWGRFLQLSPATALLAPPWQLHEQDEVIWNDGVAPTMATGYRFSLLHDAAGLPPHAEGLVDAVAVPELARRYAGMDFLLLHGADVTQAAPALAAQWTQVAESGGWMLLRRNAADGARR